MKYLKDFVSYGIQIKSITFVIIQHQEKNVKYALQKKKNIQFSWGI